MSNYLSTQSLYSNISNTTYLIRLSLRWVGLYPRGYWSYWHGVIGVTGLWGYKVIPRDGWGYTLGVTGVIGTEL